MGKPVHRIEAYEEGQGGAQGAFGTVKSVQRKQDPAGDGAKGEGPMFALKTIALGPITDEKVFHVTLREASIMEELGHPNIARLKEVFVSTRRLDLIMEWCGGGSVKALYSPSPRGGGHKRASEACAQHIVKQVAAALKHCHDRGIAHRDVKLANLMFATGASGEQEQQQGCSVVKLVDFGTSTRFHPGEVSRDVMGTVPYVAPEVITSRQHRPPEVDIWCLGLVAYELIAGSVPFSATTIGQHRFDFDLASDYSWRVASEAARHFTRKALQVNPSNRPTAEQANAHPWLSSAGLRK